MPKIIVLPGDGIGPEVTEEARACLAFLSVRCDLDLDFEEHDFGGVAIDRHGTPLPDATLAACRDADAILLGAVGGPKWDGAKERPEAGLLEAAQRIGAVRQSAPGRGDLPAWRICRRSSPRSRRGPTYWWCAS